MASPAMTREEMIEILGYDPYEGEGASSSSAPSGAAAGGAGGGSSGSWKKGGPLISQAAAFRAASTASTASGGAGGSSAPYGLPLPSQEAAFAAFKRYEATIPKEGPLPATPAPPTIIRMHSARQHKPSSIIAATASSPAAAAAAGLPEDHPLTAAEEAEADRLDAAAAAAEAAEKAAAPPASEPVRVTRLREAQGAAAAAGKKLPERVVMVICHGELMEIVHRGNIFLPQCYAESTDVDMNAVTGGLIVVAGTPGSVLTVLAARDIMTFMKTIKDDTIERLQTVFPPLAFQKVHSGEARPAGNVSAPSNSDKAASIAALYANSIAFVAPTTVDKTSLGTNYQPENMKYGKQLKEELQKFGTAEQKVTFKYPMESFTINCSRIIPPIAGELSPYSTRILNYTLTGRNIDDPVDVKQMIGIYVLNTDKWIKVEDLSELDAKPGDSFYVRTEKMIERIIRDYSWNGVGDPFTIRLIMQHCGSISSLNPSMQDFYTRNSHLVLAQLPKIAVYNNKRGVLLAMLSNLAAPIHRGGSRQNRRASKTKRRKSKHYAKYSRKNRRNAGRV